MDHLIRVKLITPFGIFFGGPFGKNIVCYEFVLRSTFKSFLKRKNYLNMFKNVKSISHLESSEFRGKRDNEKQSSGQ